MLENFATPIKDSSLKNPFPGLRPFQSNESDLFFGREGQSNELLVRLSKTHFLAVVGRSGSGKSSLVRAGLLASLQGGWMGKAGSGWHIALLSPGGDPIGNLSRALNQKGGLEMEDDKSRIIQTQVSLRRDSRGLVEIVHEARLPQHENLLVVVDQFEELFRYDRISEDEKYANDADALVKLLLEARRESNIYVVLTMRSEYLGECARFLDLPEAINEGQYLIPRMPRDNCREAITAPVELRHARISPSLVNQLLNDMTLVDTRNQLPVLQHALMRIWEKWREKSNESDEIDFRHYEMIGGMSQTLDRHAEEAFGELPDERSRTIAEKLFKCLTEKGADGRETRRPTPLKEISLIADATKQEVIDVIDIFRSEDRLFLMPSGNVPLKGSSSIDISHESLINGWKQLKGWVDDQANSARVYRNLVENAIDYPKEGLTEPRLLDTLDWRKRDKPNRFWARRHHARFYERLSPSVKGKARDKEIFSLAMGFLDKSERQHKKHKRQKQQIVLVVALLLIGTFVLSGSLWSARERKIINAINDTNTRNRKRNNYKTDMNAAQTAYEERTFGDASRMLNDLLLPNRGVELRGLDWYYLWRALHNERATLRGHAGQILTVAFSPDNKIIATGSTDKTVRLWDAGTLMLLEGYNVYNDSSAGVQALAFASDSKTLAIGDQGGSVKLWKTNIDPEPKPLVQVPAQVSSLAFEKDGSRLVISSSDGVVRVLDTTTPPESRSVKMKIWKQKVRALKAESPETHARSNPTRARSGQISFDVSVAFSPDGTEILCAGTDNTVKLFDASSLRLIKSIPIPKDSNVNEPEGNPAPISSVAFSPDGKTIAAGCRNGEIRLWGRDGRKETVIPGRPSILALTFVGIDTVVTANGDATLTLWDIRGTGKEIRTFKGHSGEVRAVAVSSDGKVIVTGSADSTAKVWDVTAPTDKLLGSTGPVKSVAFSPGKGDDIMASAGHDGTLKVWDLSTKREKMTFNHQSSPILAVAFSPDGQVIASGNAGGDVVLSNVSTGESKLLGRHEELTSVAFAPDGKTLATGSKDHTVKIWDVSTGESFSLAGHEHTVWSVAFSPDGKVLASGGADPNVIVWDVSTWASRALPVHSQILSLAFSADSRLLAGGGADFVATVWDATAGYNVREILTGHQDAVLSVAFSPDGTRLATGCYDGSVKFWDTNPNPEEPTREFALATLISFLPDGDPNVFLWSLAFSPDGQILATGRDDGSVELWRVASKEEVWMQQQKVFRDDEPN